MVSDEVTAIVRNILKWLDKNSGYDLRLESCYVMSDDSKVYGDKAIEISSLYSDHIRTFNMENNRNPYSITKHKWQLHKDVREAYFHISEQDEIYPERHCYSLFHNRPDSEPTPSPKENEEILYKFLGVLRETLKFKAKNMETTANIVLGKPRREMLKPEEQELLIEYFNKNIKLDPGLHINSCDEDIWLVSSTLPALPDFITPNSGHYEYYY